MSAQLIAANTAFTYIRFLISACLLFISSRWILQALGQTDFGLFSIVGSLILFVTFLNNLMAISVARYFAYSIGEGNLAEVKGWFNAALSIHVGLAFILIAIGWPVGEYVISNVLKIPESRVETCILVFRISLISAFVSMLAVPFTAMFIAQQRIIEAALWGITQAFLTFSLAWVLLSVEGDRLLFYAIGMVLVITFIQSGQIVRALIIFCECRIDPQIWFNKIKCKQLFSFSMWSMFGTFGALLRDQGSALLLNFFFNPSANAAYAIAMQVSNQTNQFSMAMLSAFSPAITTAEGSGDRNKMLLLSARANKFGTVLISLFAIPLIIEMDLALVIWLGASPPPYAPSLCQLILATLIIDRLSTGYMMAVSAHGKIAAYQVTLGTSAMLTLPVGWLSLESGYPPSSIGFAFLSIMCITSFGRVLWGRYLFGISIRAWMVKVVWPCFAISAIGMLTALAFQWLMQPSLLRLLSGATASIIFSLMTMWFIALDSDESKFIKDATRRLSKKILRLKVPISR